MIRPDAATRVKLALAAFLAARVVLGSAPVLAQSQDLGALNDRIERLQRDVDVLQRQLARQGGGTPARGGAPAAAPSGEVPTSFIDRTESRFDSVDDQIRDLTNKTEVLTNQVDQLKSRLDKLISDVDFRLNALEKGGAAPVATPGQSGAATPPNAPANAAASGPSPSQAQVAPGQQRLVLVPGPKPAAGSATPATAVAPTVELPQGSPEAQYEFAYGVLLQAQREQSDFGRAEQALRAFINANPTHRLAGNAQYWLGETYYVRKKYQDAAATFAEGLQKYPKSDKAPDNLLKLGMSLAQLNHKQEACGALSELSKRYPNAAPQVKTAGQRERTRLGCT
jgi:tol-pal system protein YbgF